MRFKQLFYEMSDYNKKDSLKKIEQYYDQCVNKYFSEYKNKLKRPIFKIKNMSNKAGLWSSKENTMFINPDITMNDELLRSVVYHETIHVFEDVMDKPFLFDRAYDPHRCKHFQSLMNKINADEGGNFINITQDALAIKESAKPFYVYFIEMTKGDIVFIWSNKESDVLKSVVQRQSKISFPGVPFWAISKEGYLKNTPPATDNTKRFSFSLVGSDGTDQEKAACHFLKNHPDKTEIK